MLGVAEPIADVEVISMGAKIMEASPKVSVNTDITPQIAFWEGCNQVRGYGVISVFNKIHTKVSEIIESFVSSF